MTNCSSLPFKQYLICSKCRVLIISPSHNLTVGASLFFLDNNSSFLVVIKLYASSLGCPLNNRHIYSECHIIISSGSTCICTLNISKRTSEIPLQHLCILEQKIKLSDKSASTKLHLSQRGETF